MVPGRSETCDLLVGSKVEFVDRQRPDLSLERYEALTTEASINFEGHAFRQFQTLVGGGAQWRKIFGLKVAADG